MLQSNSLTARSLDMKVVDTCSVVHLVLKLHPTVATPSVTPKHISETWHTPSHQTDPKHLCALHCLYQPTQPNHPQHSSSNLNPQPFLLLSILLPIRHPLRQARIDSVSALLLAVAAASSTKILPPASSMCSTLTQDQSMRVQVQQICVSGCQRGDLQKHDMDSRRTCNMTRHKTSTKVSGIDVSREVTRIQQTLFVKCAGLETTGIKLVGAPERPDQAASATMERRSNGRKRPVGKQTRSGRLWRRRSRD